MDIPGRPDGDPKDLAYAGGDYLLGSLATAVTAAGAGVGVTLIAGGAVVHGTAIPAARYFERLGALLGGAVDGLPEAEPEAGAALESALARMGRLAVSAAAEARTPPELGSFVYLEDAVVVTPAANVHVGLWRGRLSAVAGWSLGRPE